MSPSDNSQHGREIRRLEPHMLERQRRALERIAARLDAQRPGPPPEFVELIEGRIGELDLADYEAPRASGPTRWWLGATAFLALGLGLLVVAALMVAAGAPGGH